MKVSFVKMTGAGNDFVMLDNRDGSLSKVLNAETISFLCDRHFGIGADGLLAVEPAESEGADFRMRYFNSDGGEADMCGNGARCFARFASLLRGNETAPLTFETRAGLIRAHFEANGNVAVGLTAPRDLALETLPPSEIVPAAVHFINTGVPHAVAFLPTVDDIDIVRMGAFLRYHPRFAPAGTNANFAAVLAPQHLKIRTYERGVEGETLACGTGMTATALIHAALTNAPSPICLDVAGGDTLSIAFSRDGLAFSDVTLTGPATVVFQGTISVPHRSALSAATHP